jgi:uncharacterized protein (DUF433 family)
LILRLRQEGFPPREIKRALDVIRDMSEGDPHAWMKSSIYIDGKLIVAILSGAARWNPVAASKGPQKMAVVFFPELIKELERELVPDRFQHVEVNPEILGVAPVIKGTRIPTHAVVEQIHLGQDPQIAYPILISEQIVDAKAYEEFLDVA